MLISLQNYFGPETIYLWLSFGVLPFWLTLIFFPNSRISLVFISSIFLPIIFSLIYGYMIYQLIINSENIFDIFDLYSGIENLYLLFSNDVFLLIFWIHFLGINLFLGSWVSMDALRYNVPKFLSAISLVSIYFTGPFGLVLYWFFRIFYSKKISLYD
jgi:hypothetical protein|tara:strand:+ start:1214 stop:1687 length:474 start_codon:yes stop_codon:yes gene_type:complete